MPPGWESAAVPLRRLVKRWARKQICDAINGTAEYDLDCMTTGDSSRNRPQTMAWGDGAFTCLPHADGVGTFRANEIIWERRNDGLYIPMDFTRIPPTHFNLTAIAAIVGATTDQELLSFMLHGVHWKVDAPRQFRVGRNVESLKPRVAKVGRATRKLIDAGLYTCVPLRGVDKPVDLDNSSFAQTVPAYCIGIGGVDKPDNPDESRKVGDTSSPRLETGVLTREDYNGTAQGIPVVSFNDLTGPRRVPEGYQGHVSFPDPEVKSRPRDIYVGLAWLTYLAGLLDTYVCGFKDDIRWMFWQFKLATSQLWLSNEYLWLPFDTPPDSMADDTAARTPGDDGDTDHWYFCAVQPLVMNMGTRPASKVACRFSEALQEHWRGMMREYVRDYWIHRQTTAVVALLDERAQTLGQAHADPFWCTLYTDDFDKFFCCLELLTVGAEMWRAMTSWANIWMSAKVGAGTIINSHGGRYVLSGGFGCLTPNKVLRCTTACLDALGDGLDRELYESNCSFITHVDDIVNLAHGSRHGIFAPLRTVQQGLVKLNSTGDNGTLRWPRARDSYRAVVDQLRSGRAAASYWCAIPDHRHDNTFVPDTMQGGGGPTVTYRSSSDACTNPTSGRPYVFGFMHGQYWTFSLDGPWALKHINVREGMGPIGNLIIFGKEAGSAKHVIDTDSTSAASMVLGTATSEDLRVQHQCFRECPSYQRHAENTYCEHCAGFGEVYGDLGSRDEWPALLRLAAANGVKLQSVPLPQEFLSVAAEVLRRTSDYYTADALQANPRPMCRCRCGCTAQCTEHSPFCEHCSASTCSCSCKGCTDAHSGQQLLVSVLCRGQVHSIDTLRLTDDVAQLQQAAGAASGVPAHELSLRSGGRLLFPGTTLQHCGVFSGALIEATVTGEGGSSCGGGDTYPKLWALHMGDYDDALAQQVWALCVPCGEERIHRLSAWTNTQASFKCQNFSNCGAFVRVQPKPLRGAGPPIPHPAGMTATCVYHTGNWTGTNEHLADVTDSLVAKGSLVPTTRPEPAGGGASASRRDENRYAPTGAILPPPTAERPGTIKRENDDYYILPGATSSPNHTREPRCRHLHHRCVARCMWEPPQCMAWECLDCGLVMGCACTTAGGEARLPEASPPPDANGQSQQTANSANPNAPQLRAPTSVALTAAPKPGPMDGPSPSELYRWNITLNAWSVEASAAASSPGAGEVPLGSTAMDEARGRRGKRRRHPPEPVHCMCTTAAESCSNVAIPGKRGVAGDLCEWCDDTNGHPCDCQCAGPCIFALPPPPPSGSEAPQGDGGPGGHSDEQSIADEVEVEARSNPPTEDEASYTAHGSGGSQAGGPANDESPSGCGAGTQECSTQTDRGEEGDDGDNSQPRRQAPPPEEPRGGRGLDQRMGAQQATLRALKALDSELARAPAGLHALGPVLHAQLRSKQEHAASWARALLDRARELGNACGEIRFTPPTCIGIVAAAAWLVRPGPARDVSEVLDTMAAASHSTARRWVERLAAHLPAGVDAQMRGQATHPRQQQQSTLVLRLRGGCKGAVTTNKSGDTQVPLLTPPMPQPVSRTAGAAQATTGPEALCATCGARGSACIRNPTVCPRYADTPIATMGDADLSPVGVRVDNIAVSADEPTYMPAPFDEPSPPTPPMFQHPPHSHPLPASHQPPHGIDEMWQRQQVATQHSLAAGDFAECIAPIEGAKGSPQPLSAPAARRRAAEEQASLLASDTSPFALLRGEPDRLRDMVLQSAQERHDAIRPGTARNDKWGFAWAMKFGLAHNTPWMRPRVVTPAEYPREAHFYAFLIMWLATAMSPSKRTRDRGFDQAKPDSALQAIHGYRRVLADCHRHLIDLSLCMKQLKALRDAYMKTWGDDALVAQRAQPFERRHLLAAVQALTSYSMDWTATVHDAMLVLLCWLCATGSRNMEVATVVRPIDINCGASRDYFYRRANFTLFFGGAEVLPTPDNLRAAKNGWYVRARSQRSKCDQTNAHWGGKDMYFVYDDTNPLNFAWRWVQWELKYPCDDPADRGKWAAFSPTGKANAFTTDQTTRYHKALFQSVMGALAGAAVTIHWHRVTLACALLSLGYCDGTIQNMLRWKTDSAMRIYARMKPSTYSNIIEHATRADASARADRSQLPELGPWGAHERVQCIIDYVEGRSGHAPHGRATTVGPASSSATEASTSDRDVPNPRGQTAAKRKAPLHGLDDQGDRRAAAPEAATPMPAPAGIVPRTKYQVDERTYMWGGAWSPHGLVGLDTNLPDGMWRREHEGSGKLRKYTVVAFATEQEMYILRSHELDIHFAFHPDFLISFLRKDAAKAARTEGRRNGWSTKRPAVPDGSRRVRAK